MQVLKDIQIEAKSRMISMLERQNPSHPEIANLTYELLVIYSQEEIQETHDI
jgi:hypothetical protein